MIPWKSEKFAAFIFLLTYCGRFTKASRLKRSAAVIIEDDVCANACLNLLQVATDEDGHFRNTFTELSRLGTVTPRTFISKVDLATFQRYCQEVYVPARECLQSCSKNFTGGVLRNLTMLETMCVEHYQEMNYYLPCMQYAHKISVAMCDSRCSFGNFTTDTTTDKVVESTEAVDITTARPIAETVETTIVPTTSDTPVSTTGDSYLRPNETMAIFCLLLECVSDCDLPVIEKQCGRRAAILEAILIDSLMRTEKVVVETVGPLSIWPDRCDRLLLASGNMQHCSSWLLLFIALIQLFRLVETVL